MIVSKKFKLTTLLIAMVSIVPTLASYNMSIPLETALGGALPDGSINIGNGTDSGNPSTPPSSNCIYDNGTFVVQLNRPDDGFQKGDKFYWYNGIVIAWDSPSNGFTAPAGLSTGAFKTTNPEQQTDDLHELCADNPSSYPPFVFPTGPDGPPPTGPIDPPINDQTGPDWTPECILNTSTDYAAQSKSTGKREFHSVTFGLNHLVPSGWNYVPSDYNPNNPTSYIYFDHSEQTGDPRVSGPNADFTYAEICRVRKRDL